jgi:CheY-like chemotaxis protein
MPKILVVDDDPDFVDITCTILKSADEYEVLTAANGRQALSVMRRDKPDLVLLDVMMSYILDGLDVSQEMRKDPELKDVPIIMISSLTTARHTNRFPTDEYVPIDAWISKPIEPAVLLNTVARALGRPVRERPEVAERVVAVQPAKAG